MYIAVNPAMLVLARESRGIVQSKLSQELGVSQGKLSKAEKGEQGLSEEHVAKISKHLDYPVKFFYQITPVSPISHYYYRRRLSLSQKKLIQIEAQIKVFKNNIDDLIEATEIQDYKFESLYERGMSPAEVARRIRYLLRIPKGTIENLVNLVERAGIIVVKTDILPERMDGLSTITDKGTRVIFLNMHMSNDRQRFSLAHEFGHMLMHFDIIPPEDSNIEIESNLFAGELLMPKDEILSYLQLPNFSKLGDLKRYWKVSIKALIYRARYLNTINDNEYRNLMINYSKKGMNKREPIMLPSEDGFMLKEIVRLHKEELGYTDEELALILKISMNDYNRGFDFSQRTKLKVIRPTG